MIYECMIFIIIFKQNFQGAKMYFLAFDFLKSTDERTSPGVQKFESRMLKCFHDFDSI